MTNEFEYGATLLRESVLLTLVNWNFFEQKIPQLYLMAMNSGMSERYALRTSARRALRVESAHSKYKHLVPASC